MFAFIPLQTIFLFDGLFLSHGMQGVKEVKIDGSVVREHDSGDTVSLVFTPREIKLCTMKR